ncbi:MAG: ROK family protein [Clostridia bacterium]|nr:ROK family protein [Clostridia bacterium]
MKKIALTGVSIGGTKSAVSHAFFDGKELSDISKVTFPTNPLNADETIDKIIKELDKIEDVGKISVICGGPLDCKRGIIQKPPHLPGFDNVNIIKILNGRYGAEVTLLNDADACALAEFLFGAGKGSENMAFLTFGTGIGSGLILGGKLYTGNNGMAGEIGHLRLSKSGEIGYGKRGSVESFVSGGAIGENANKRRIGRDTLLNSYEKVTAKEVAECARKGDKLSIKIMNEVADKLGETVSILIDMLNLDRVVIGGIYPRCLDILEKKVIRSAKKNSIGANFDVCEIVPSKLGESIDEYSSLAPAII